MNLFSEVPQVIAEDPECVEVDRVQKEMDDFTTLDLKDFSLGLETAAAAGSQPKFNPLKFYANPSIASRFPLHVKVAKSYFASILHEATSERSFSICGQKLGDLRQRTDKNIICAQVRVVTAEKNVQLPAPEIAKYYKSRPRKRRNESDQGDGLADLSDSDEELESNQGTQNLPQPLPPPPAYGSGSD